MAPLPRKEPKVARDLSLSTNGEGRVERTLRNLHTLLAHHEDWKGVIARDVRGQTTVFRRRPPFPTPVTCYPAEVTDADATQTQLWLADSVSVEWPIAKVHQIIDAVADEQRFDPVAEYLGELRWDGTPRLDRWLSTYLGASPSKYARAVGRRWMISAVARAFEPGCKADALLVLEGPQGAGKSTAARILAGDDHFADAIGDLGTKESREALRGLWIVELAELEGMRRREVATVKNFLSASADRFREAYARRAHTVPRRCVFIGTTNEEAYLGDATGNRRFWPVRITGADLEALTRDRDQLWAEARDLYRADERWHLTTDEEVLARREQSKRETADPWESRVLDFIANRRDGVGVSDILEHACGVNVGRQDKSTEQRVTALLRARGWHKAKRSPRPGEKRRWLWFPAEVSA